MTDEKRKITDVLLDRPHEKSLSTIGSPMEKAVGPLIMICLGLWIAGCIVPMVTTEKLIFFRQDYSVFVFIKVLFDEREWLLLIVVALFSVGNPLFKLDRLYWVWRHQDAQGEAIKKTMKMIDFVSKWSMGDVFVIAVSVVIAKTSSILADAYIRPGLYLFAASSLGSMMAAYMLRRAVERRQTQ